MEECLRDIKANNHYIKLKTINTIKEQMTHCQLKTIPSPDRFDNIKQTRRSESEDGRFVDFKDTMETKWRTPDVIKYLSFMIVVWIFFAIYSYLHNRCMLYGGSNCMHMNPFIYQNCNSDNYVF